MRDFFWIIGIFLFAVIVYMPWFSIYDWLQKQRGKKYEAHDGVI